MSEPEQEPQEPQARRIESRRRRRAWTVEEKRRIVAETLAPGTSISIVARRHDVNANLLFTWRRRFGAAPLPGSGEVAGFVPAAISAPAAPPILSTDATLAGRMEIVLAGGDRVIVGADVDAGALGRVLKALSRR